MILVSDISHNHRYELVVLENEQQISLCIRITKIMWEGMMTWMKSLVEGNGEIIEKTYGNALYVPDLDGLFENSWVCGIGKSVEVCLVSENIIELRFTKYAKQDDDDDYVSHDHLKNILISLGFVLEYLNFLCDQTVNEGGMYFLNEYLYDQQPVVIQMYYNADVRTCASRYSPSIVLSKDCLHFLNKTDEVFDREFQKTMLRLRNQVFSQDDTILYYPLSVKTAVISLQTDCNCACVAGRRDGSDADALLLSPHNMDTPYQSLYAFLVFAKIFELYAASLNQV